MFNLCLDENSAGNTPLVTLVSQNETDMALKLWDYMYEVDCIRLLGRIKYRNKSNRNIMHRIQTVPALESHSFNYENTAIF